MVRVEIYSYTGWMILIGFIFISILSFFLMKSWLFRLGESDCKVNKKALFLAIISGLAFIGLFLLFEIVTAYFVI
jgi:hypothetical protein